MGRSEQALPDKVNHSDREDDRRDPDPAPHDELRNSARSTVRTSTRLNPERSLRAGRPYRDERSQRGPYGERSEPPLRERSERPTAGAK